MDGVCSFWEAAQSLVASLAERMGLLAHTPDAVEAAREKQVRADAPLLAYNSLAASVWLCTSRVWTLGEQERSSSSQQSDAHGNTLAQDFRLFQCIRLCVWLLVLSTHSVCASGSLALTVCVTCRTRGPA